MTLTLTHRNGGLLTAFLALFVTIVARSTWRSFCYLTHIKLSDNNVPQDAVYHQRQAILRNSDDSAAGLKSLVQLAWTWRGKSEELWVRLIPAISVNAVLIAGFYVASIFSSRKLDSKISTNVSCPFPGKDRICIRNSTNFRVDTGLLDSHHDLGLNAALKDRIQFRRVIECGPIKTKGYVRARKAQPSNSTFEFGQRAIKEANYTGLADEAEYIYGETLASLLDADDNSTAYTDQSLQMVTYDYPISPSDLGPVALDYVIRAMRGAMVTPNGTLLDLQANRGDFIPIPELRLQDAKVDLFFLSSNEIAFSQPCDDDWFSAHQEYNWVEGVNSTQRTPLYQSDLLVSVLGCSHREQMCNPNKKNCSSLVHPTSLDSVVDSLWDTDKQSATSRYVLTAGQSYFSRYNEIVKILRESALMASESLIDGIKGPLPSNQWQKEVLFWHDQYMAVMQRALLEIATGPSRDSINRIIHTPTSGGGKELCHSQVSSDIHLTIHPDVAAEQLNQERIVRFLQKWRKSSIYPRLEWITNESLQLQRLAHEELGAGTWSGGTKIIPTTAKGECLAVLDVSNKKHPCLKLAPPETGEKPEERPLGMDSSTQSGNVLLVPSADLDPSEHGSPDPDMSLQTTVTVQGNLLACSHSSDTSPDGQNACFAGPQSPAEHGGSVATSPSESHLPRSNQNTDD
ncbi:MAG: hypothetical protein Q9160_009297 [Pyrenula sp. 1 TL-2023]